MRLVVDTSALVGELMRARGRRLLTDDRLELFLPGSMWEETQVELPRRVAAFVHARHLTAQAGAQILADAFAAIETNIVIIDSLVYAALEDEARGRSRRDPDDWPVVATALAVGGGIWTNDNDFLGTGVATWTTATLHDWLDRQPSS